MVMNRLLRIKALYLDVSFCKESSSRIKSNLLKDNIINDVNEDMRLRERVLNQLIFSCYVSLIEPKKLEEALNDEC